MTRTITRELARISVRGIVQGVGFRPFIYQLATRLGLSGWVCNTSEDVRIEIEGEPAVVNTFLEALRAQAPPRASIESITVSRHPPVNYSGFEIRRSVAEEGKYQLVSPDIATCPECRNDIFSPGNRRFRYPFTNCTNCGPRFTIIEDIPYDRPRTTMRAFTMCPDCQKEYDDPLDRRFHAQPNACPVCGPRLELLDAAGKSMSVTDCITETARRLKAGGIIALKGLGGFLLACDATSPGAVRELRRRKHRPFKPLAIMVESNEAAGEHCHLNEAEARLLETPASPIVLLPKKADSRIAPEVAPNIDYLGVMLPYTPLHHLLLREAGLPLVMTSGNISEEPIAKDNDEALRRLRGIADYFLVHNRDIYARYDDSVTMVERDTPQILRRARGYAPYPVHLGFQSRQILGCGAELKSTFCLTRDDYAFISQHIGDLENLETFEHFTSTIELYKKLFRIEPEIIACDMHPEYLATKFARELVAKSPGLRLVPVQHHHAHIASGMADNGLTGPVIGVALDGTGYGTDGAIWGGEFLVADYRGFTRLAHFEYLPLPGGALAIRKPYRTAIGYLLSLLGEGALEGLPFIESVDKQEIELIKAQVARKINAPLTSSCGRLFDAVSALLGIRREVDYEAQAAVEMEALAARYPGERGAYPYSIIEQDGVSRVKLAGLFAGVLADMRRGTATGLIAARFHNTIARIVLESCKIILAKTGIKQAVLSGGAYQNRRLLRASTGLLEDAGFEVYTHRQVPCNDGGISLGQVAIANFADK